MTTAPSGIVTLLTDFGLDDPYVGIMKGVALSIQRDLTLVDVCHGVPAQDVRVGALWLAHGFAWFPAGTVHVAVVDPGVGGTRVPIAARACDHYFFAPDNGLVSQVRGDDFEARRLDPDALGLEVASRTFHGRDVFIKAAAWLASEQRSFESLGPVHSARCLEFVSPVDGGSMATGHVLAADRFGNLITDLPGEWLGRMDARAELDGRTLRVVGTYSDAAEGECVALVSSFGLVEIAARNDSAKRLLGATKGARVTLLSQTG
jgi:S-adenosylmethionine hydrolase